MSAEINRPGIAHIAFEVDDAETILGEIISAGGSSVGALVTAAYPDGQERCKMRSTTRYELTGMIYLYLELRIMFISRVII